MNIRYSLSFQPYSTKPSDKAVSHMEWKIVTTGEAELKKYIGKGYTINHIYKEEAFDENGYISKSNATLDNFASSQIIFVDIDNTKSQSIQDFTALLSILPTFSYYTPHDSLDARRFRLVYVLDMELDYDKWKLFAKFIHSQIEKDTSEIIKDKCGEINNQYANGATCISTIIPGDGLIHYDDYITALTKFHCAQTKSSKEWSSVRFDRKSRDGFDADFLYDLENLKPSNIKKKYGRRYKYVTRTEHEDWKEYTDPQSGETIYPAYQYTDKNYAERMWYAKYGSKVHNGENRRRKLFLRACITRLIDPSLNKSNVLYNVWLDRVDWFDNHDGVLKLDRLIEYVNCAFHSSIEELRSKLSINKKVIIHKFIKDKTLQAKIRAYALKQLQFQRIGDVYDTSKSVEQNVEYLTSIGIKISRASLFRFAKENGISGKIQKKNQIAEIQKLSELGKSKKEIMEILGVTIGQVNWARKIYKNNEEDQIFH